MVNGSDVTRTEQGRRPGNGTRPGKGNGTDRVVSSGWRRSSHSSSNGACVELAAGGASVLARDSKHPEGGVLGFTAAPWSRFVSSVKAGRYDLG